MVEPLADGRFHVRGDGKGESDRVGSRNIHRGRTGNAERQGFKVSRFEGF
jgi:hypothetical protein